MGDTPPDLLVAVFEDADRADRADRALSEAEGGGRIRLLAAAVIGRLPDGRPRWRIRGPEPARLAARADAIATMLDVLLPARVVLAALAGTAGEGATEAFASGVAEAVPPGGAVVIAVVDDRWVSEIGRGVRGYHRLAGAQS